MSALGPKRIRYALVPLLAALATQGCSAAAGDPPTVLREADARALAGEEAYLSGRPERAIVVLSEAARMQVASGDLPGGARTLLNLALAERATGDIPAATRTAAHLREILPAAQQQVRERDDGGQTPDDLAAGCSWLDALLALDRGQRSLAAQRLEGVPREFSPKSPWPGRLETLRAELALAESRWDDARRHAKAGRDASHDVGDRAEEARALRFGGAAAMELGQWADARDDLLAAVKIEESLGGGSRMVGDLRRLAIVSGRLGNEFEANVYTERARIIDAAH